jgi:hypothetical protein
MRRVADMQQFRTNLQRANDLPELWADLPGSTDVSGRGVMPESAHLQWHNDLPVHADLRWMADLPAAAVRQV